MKKSYTIILSMNEDYHKKGVDDVKEFTDYKNILKNIPLDGLEPSTSRFVGGRSIQLS